MTQDRAMVRNAADPKQVGRAGTREKRAQDLRNARTTFIMSTYEGRWWVWDHLSDLGAFESIFVTSSEIYYRAGKQDVAHKLIDHITKVCPDLFVQMQRENIERAKNTEPEPKPKSDDPLTNEDEDDGN